MYLCKEGMKKLSTDILGWNMTEMLSQLLYSLVEMPNMILEEEEKNREEMPNAFGRKCLMPSIYSDVSLLYLRNISS